MLFKHKHTQLPKDLRAKENTSKHNDNPTTSSLSVPRPVSSGFTRFFLQAIIIQEYQETREAFGYLEQKQIQDVPPPLNETRAIPALSIHRIIINNIWADEHFLYKNRLDEYDLEMAFIKYIRAMRRVKHNFNK